MGFDIAVVGGGAAGCVIAARLAGFGRSVVLIEAGPDRRGAVPSDLRDGWHLGQPPDWGFSAEPDERGEAPRLRRSRLLGGTSWLTRFALRGSPADFDGWERLGNPGWNFETILPSFRRLERDLEFGGRAWHGDAGPIPVTRYPDIARTPVHQAIVDAAEDLGFPRVEDHNEPGAIGIGPMPMSSVDGVRVTTTAYLDDLSTKPVILPDSPVAEVAFDACAPPASGWSTAGRSMPGSWSSAPGPTAAP
jgi:choline dehydrogenase